MQITFLANCGILLQGENDAILVDAPNGLHTAFDGFPETEYEKILSAEQPYNGLKAMFFSHRHSDHYDKKRVREILRARENVCAYASIGATPTEGVVQAGEFTVRYFSIPHSGEEFSDVPHRVLLAEADGKRVYMTGDAVWDANAHRQIIDAFSPNVAVWNPNYMTHAEGRELMSFVGENYIYHLPVAAEDVFGFGRKCRKDFEKFGNRLPVRLVDKYPFTVHI